MRALSPKVSNGTQCSMSTLFHIYSILDLWKAHCLKCHLLQTTEREGKMKEQIMSLIFRHRDNSFCAYFQNIHPSSALTLLLQLKYSFGDILTVTDLLLTEPGKYFTRFSQILIWNIFYYCSFPSRQVSTNLSQN